MNRTEYHARRRRKFAELAKNRVDDALNFYRSLSDEEKHVAEFTFARKIAKHFCLSIGIARNVTNNLIAEYKVEFVKYKMSSHSRGFTGKKHSAETRAKIAAASIKCNAARAIMCKEHGLNYRNFKQDADKQIKVDNFCKASVKDIDSSKIII